MKISSRCISYGDIPYENVEAATKMMAKLFDKLPYLPFMPNISKEDNLIKRSLVNIPSIVISESGKIVIKPAEKFKEKLKRLDKAFNNPVIENLDEFGFEAPFLEKYLQIVKKFKPANACISILGPFTLSQKLRKTAEEQMLVDKSYRKIFIQAVCVKAMWAIEKIKSYSANTQPIIILEEPLFNRFGDIKRENEDVTVEVITAMFARIIEKIKSAGGLVCIQCMDKCDWQIPINAGVDMISFDAYNNPNNLTIIPETIIDFVSRGGKINWAIVPTKSEALVKSLSLDYLRKRLYTTFEGLVMAGVPEKFVYNSATVSIQGGVGHLPLIFAEKALILSMQLSKKIPVKS